MPNDAYHLARANATVYAPSVAAVAQAADASDACDAYAFIPRPGSDYKCVMITGAKVELENSKI